MATTSFFLKGELATAAFQLTSTLHSCSDNCIQRKNLNGVEQKYTFTTTNTTLLISLPL
jgi:hypothetical protein